MFRLTADQLRELVRPSCNIFDVMRAREREYQDRLYLASLPEDHPVKQAIELRQKQFEILFRLMNR